MKNKKKEKYNIKYFIIAKIVEELNGNGKYLLLKYNCTGITEIENINPNLNIGIIFS